MKSDLVWNTQVMCSADIGLKQKEVRTRDADMDLGCRHAENKGETECNMESRRNRDQRREHGRTNLKT